MSAVSRHIDAPRVCFVVESSTDVRLAEGMAERFSLTLLARKVTDGVEISQPPSLRLKVVVGATSRAQIVRPVITSLRSRRHDYDHVIVQGCGPYRLSSKTFRGG